MQGLKLETFVTIEGEDVESDLQHRSPATRPEIERWKTLEGTEPQS
jgi:hypothetical protein